jgi:hypothetical protein
MKTFLSLAGIIAGLAAISATADIAPDETVSTASLLREESDFSRLPLHRNWSAHLDSSCDKTGGNNDCQQFISKDGDTALLADLKGPGAIVRIWSTAVAKAGNGLSSVPTGILKIYLDDNPKPVIDMPFGDLFKGNAPFVRPLTMVNGAGYFTYLPMPYATHCRITVDKPDQLFYQINSIRFSDDTKVRPFSLPLPTADQTALDRAVAGWTLPPIASTDAPAPNTTRLTIPAGKSAEIPKLTGPATIQSLTLSAPGVSDSGLRKLILRVWFDDHKAPDIEAPVADFFGNAYGHKVFESLFFSQNTSGDMTFRLPMPFNSNARLSIENGAGDPVALDAALVVKPGALHSGSLYLHADFNQEITVKGKAHTWARVQGSQGHFVGVVQTMQGSHTLGFCEGDDQVRVDDEKFVPSATLPTVVAPSNGTGTEDGFNSAWYFSEGEKALPMNGCLIRQDFGRIDTFRFFLNDAPVFQQSLDAQIENGDTNSSAGDYYSSVAFWYGNGERTPIAPMPAAVDLGFPKIAFQGQPIVIEGESLVPNAKATGSKVKAQEMTGLQNVWSNDSQLFWTGGKKDDTLTVPFQVTDAGSYVISILAAHGPSYGYYLLSLNGTALSRRDIDTYSPNLENRGPIELGTVTLPAGTSKLVITLGGKNGQSTGNDVGLDAIVLRKAN